MSNNIELSTEQQSRPMTPSEASDIVTWVSYSPFPVLVTIFSQSTWEGSITILIWADSTVGRRKGKTRK